MPQPVTHYFVCEQAMGQMLPAVWAANANFAGFGTFGPDVFYIREFGQTEKYQKTADTIHAEGTYDCFCAMLDYIKKSDPSQGRRDKMKAFAYGFYSHVVTDCVFHPFVYRQTNDLWTTHEPEANYLMHKELEADIDNYLIALRRAAEPGFKPSINVNCHSRNSVYLDADVFAAFREGLASAYRGKIDDDVYGRFFLDAEDNSIHRAYRDYFVLLGIDYLSIQIRDKNLMNRERILDLSDWTPADLERMNEPGRPWHTAPGNGVLAYSVQQLYAKAVSATRKVIEVSEEFFQLPNESSDAYFTDMDPIYLQGNNNLDTGLPSADNEDADNRSDDPDVRFAYKLDDLAHCYDELA